MYSVIISNKLLFADMPCVCALAVKLFDKRAAYFLSFLDPPCVCGPVVGFLHRLTVCFISFLDPPCVRGPVVGSFDRLAISQHRFPQHLPADISCLYDGANRARSSEARLSESRIW